MLHVTNYFKKKKSKKGLTLVEVLCAIFVLAIVFVGVLNAVAFSREMVFTNNAREKASFKGQLVADEIFSTATGSDPSTLPVSDLKDKLEEVINNMSDPQNSDADTAVGTVRYVTALTDPGSFTVTDDCYIEYTIEPITAEKDDSVSAEGVTYTDAVEKGWNITVRVFYKEITANSDFRCEDISIFAPFNYIS